MKKLDGARQVMIDRELCVSQVFDTIESDMTLLGATGVEDQLQDGVAETLEALRAAGIKVQFDAFIIVKRNFNFPLLVGLGFDWWQTRNGYQHCLFMWSL